jgi:hypothetical protein
MRPWPIVFITSWLDVGFLLIHIKKEFKIFFGFQKRAKIIQLKSKGYMILAIIIFPFEF